VVVPIGCQVVDVGCRSHVLPKSFNITRWPLLFCVMCQPLISTELCFPYESLSLMVREDDGHGSLYLFIFSSLHLCIGHEVSPSLSDVEG
jgi:hypothetical protein